MLFFFVEFVFSFVGFYLLNKSLTRRAPWPTRISSNSGPATWKNGTPASPAIARANNVFPVPGGPTNNTPFGNFPPRAENLSGFFKNSTTFRSSCFASSTYNFYKCLEYLNLHKLIVN